MHKYRTHNCNELTKQNINQIVKLSRWVHKIRDHGNLLFVDLRDMQGITQLAFSEKNATLLKEAEKIKHESVITISGKVITRSEDAINTELKTGEIEIEVESLIIENIAEPLPIPVSDDQPQPEELRLKYRFLDLRKKNMRNNILLRSKIIAKIRELMIEQNFVEFQTPILTANSPEGARDFLVPSRLHPGKFYALPQAPQQFKQLFMVSGFDKYFQIAPCFRDEDARADRSPGEFYQLDIEMAFVTQEDVFKVTEEILYKLFKEFSDFEINSPFERISWEDAMLCFGSDKPDLRNPIKISDVTDIFEYSGFSVFVNQIKKGAVVRAVPAPKCASSPRSFFDKMIEFAISQGAGGLAYINFDEDNNAKGPIAKFLNEAQAKRLQEKVGLAAGDSVFFACSSELEAAAIAGKVRTKLGTDLDLIAKDKFRFCWVTDFPFYELDSDGKIDFSHNPFSMPQGGLKALKDAEGNLKKLLAIKAFQYDIVCNGIELSSGAIRNHKLDVMQKAFEIVGYGKAILEEKFAAMSKAFKYGAPPHGGIAPGIDRIIMLLAGADNIREVIAFPLNQKAEDLMMGAPSSVEEKQLKELNIKIDIEQ